MRGLTTCVKINIDKLFDVGQLKQDAWKVYSQNQYQIFTDRIKKLEAQLQKQDETIKKNEMTIMFLNKARNESAETLRQFEVKYEEALKERDRARADPESVPALK